MSKKISNESIIKYIFVFELLMAVVLTFAFLGEKSFWLDEIFSLNLTGNWDKMWKTLLNKEPNMWIYHVLLYFWSKLGNSEFFIRSLSAMFSIATVPVVFIIGKKIYNSKTGLIAVFFLITNSFYIAYAQEARGYSMMLFFTSLSSLVFLLYLEKRSWRISTAYIFSIVLSIFSHLLSGTILFVHSCSFILVKRDKENWKNYLFCIATILIMIMLFYNFFNIGTSSQNISWIEKPDLKSMYATILKISGGDIKVFIITMLLVLISIIFSTITLICKRSFKNIWQYFFAISWLILPFIILYVYSIFFKPVFIPRYLIITLTPLALLAANGLCRIRTNWLAGFVVLIYLFFSVPNLYKYYSSQKENWRDTVSFVLANSKSDDVVIFYTYFIKSSFEYYLNKNGSDNKILILKNTASESKFSDSLDSEPLPDMTKLKKISEQDERVWLILSHHNNKATNREKHALQIKSYLDYHYKNIEKKTFKNIEIYLYYKK